jgi:glycosyltransferase involved in cell wall biosynthesis
VNRATRVAFFPDAYHEIDGVANTSLRFEAFARQRGLPFLIVHAGPHNQITQQGSVLRVQLRRSRVGFSLDRDHEYDLLFLRHYWRVKRLLLDFNPDVVHITGPSELGIMGALLAHRLGVALAASWQTNLHQYARSRAGRLLRFIPERLRDGLLDMVERGSFRATGRFYKIPQVLFAPNPELVALLRKATGKSCFFMSHAADTGVFSPEFRDRQGGPFRIGYVGRLTAEKNVRLLARLEGALLASGHRDFRIVLVGQGAEEAWLRKNLRQAEFTGVLTGRDLSCAYSNFDLFVFPSETDTFGLAVLEALASGVPAVVMAGGGPKYSVQAGSTGYIARNFEELVAATTSLMSRPGVLTSMRRAAREYALSRSWDEIFDDIYRVYTRHLQVSETRLQDGGVATLA